jgi:hypothetical protein
MADLVIAARAHLVAVSVAAGLTASCAGDGGMTPQGPSTPPQSSPTPPRAVESATISISPSGFVLDSATAAWFRVGEIRVYQGGNLRFINQDSVPHDILSDPQHLHTECPEINQAGFLVPGQSRSTEPLNRLVSCGFHDHLREGDSRFSGRVVVEGR